MQSHVMMCGWLAGVQRVPAALLYILLHGLEKAICIA